MSKISVSLSLVVKFSFLYFVSGVVVGGLALAQELSNVKLTSCGPTVCTRLDTRTLHRSNFAMNIMAFGDAVLEISSPSEPAKVLQRIEAEDGYYDMKSQVIVMRSLKKSLHKELVFNLVDGKFIYF